MSQKDERSDCITENTALALLRGALSQHAAAQVHEHIADCADCRQLVSALAASSADGSADVETPDSLGELPAPNTSPPIVQGSQIGRFEIIKLLGRGGMGAVYLAKDDELQREVALKLLHSAGPDASSRLLTEARSLARLKHPNVVTVYDVGRDGDHVYVAMEYISGQTLRRWLDPSRPIERQLEVLRDAGAGLLAAHEQGLVHRDFKPENVMVGGDGRVQVLDFGLASNADIEATSAPRALVGTPAYMAPEQARGDTADARTDQFAFCVVLYEALHGERPFSDRPREDEDAKRSAPLRTSDIDEAVPPAVARALAKGLSARPEDRFDSMEPLLGILGRASRPEPRHARWRSIALVSTLLIIGGLIATGNNMPWRTSPLERRRAILEASDLPSTRATPAQGDPFKVSIHRLKNGLTIFASKNQNIPRIAVQMVIRAGSRDDPPSASGVANLARRMMDMGTQKLGTRNHAREAEALARVRRLSVELGERSAEPPSERTAALQKARADAARWALPDEFRRLSSAIGIDHASSALHPRATIFSAQMPSERFAQWAVLEGERWSSPVARLFGRELRAVGGSSPQTFDQFLYRDHAYGRPARGRAEDLSSALLPAVEAFMAQRYVPNNAALILAGDIDMTAALPILEEAFARWRPRPLIDHPHAPPAPLARSESVDAQAPDAPLVAMLGRAPASFQPRDAVVEVTKKLLEAPELWMERAKVAPLEDVRLAFERTRETRSWSLIAEPGPGQSLDAAVVALRDRLAELERAEVELGQVEGILSRARIRYNVLSTNNELRATRIAQAYADQGDWPPPYFINDTKPVTARELRKLVHHLRTTPQIVVKAEREPSIERPSPPALTETAPPWSAFAKRLIAERPAERPVRFVWPDRDYHLTSVPSGELITVINKDDEIFEVALEWSLGWSAMPALCVALAALDEAGVGETAAQRKRRWARELFSASISCERNLTSIVMRGHADHIENVASVIALLHSAKLTDAMIAKASEQYAASLSQAFTSSLQETLAQYALTGESQARVLNADPNAARAALAKMLLTQRTVRYFGPDPEAIYRFVPRDGAALEAPPAPSLSSASADPQVFVFEDARTSGVHVQLLRVLRPMEESSMPALQLFQAVARRRARRASSTVKATFEVQPATRPDEAIVRISFVSEPAQLHAHLSRIESQILSPTVGEDEWSAARCEVEASYVRGWIPPRNLTVRLATWRSRGLDNDPRPRRYAIVKGMKVHDVSAFAQRIRAVPALTIVIAAPKSMDLSKLSQRGKITRIRRSDLMTP